MKNLFLTGKIGIGKSTLLKSILESIENSLGGFLVEPIFDKEGNINTFDMMSLYDGSYGNHIGTINDMNQNSKRNKKVFDISGVDILEKSFKDRQVIVMDELGVIESEAYKFQDCVNKILSSDEVVLGVLKKKKSVFLDSIKNRSDVTVIEVTKENRDKLEGKIIDILKGWKVNIKRKYPLWMGKSLEWYNEALKNKNNRYPQVFMEKIKNDVDLKGKKIIDIGAGTGVFTFPLSLECAEVTAVDNSFTASQNVRERVRRNNLKNIKCITANWSKLNYRNKFDIAINAYCPDAIYEEENLKRLYELINEKIYIITFLGDNHRNFKVDKLYKRLNRPQRILKTTSVDVVNRIKKLGYKFNYEEIGCTFNQYFSSYDEVKEFFYSHFSINTLEEEKILNEFLHENLIKRGNILEFPNVRQSAMITINK